MAEPHVLVVDDDPPILDFIRDALESEGCGVATAASAPEALSASPSGRPR